MQREKSIGKDATSKETLKDVEEDEVSSNDDSDDTDLPSPDGAFDDPDALKDADAL